ncbi:MAG TPA: hypothetical protein VK866_18110 [Acidimicrobiales bacterium]|nr:hypothetical protein [Acidimicrobiales bacterium]
MATEVAVRLLGVDRAELTPVGDVVGDDRGPARSAGPSVPTPAPPANPTGDRLDLAIRRITVEGTWARAERRVGSDGESVTVEAGAFRLELTEVRATATRETDPLAVDLDGTGLRTTGVDGGVDMDIDGDGTVERTSNVAGGTMWVAHDRDGDGRIRDGSELFGDQHGDVDGIAALARLDSDGDGDIDRADAAWSRLGVWDGTADGAFRSLDEVGIVRFDLARRAYGAERTEGGGDRIADALTVEMGDGSTRDAADLWVRRTV